ncbi:hypothetical protein Acr_00g0048940 [Actinidia rufa]|uniref:Uncharacterized protein n=1 Tax=Actinidia rufa TaxID=165716 RepID=A0A7J0DK52_9ERIC|nr:hypothetical protein Acr_00g0048940 [Actinidia rufa]
MEPRQVIFTELARATSQSQVRAKVLPPSRPSSRVLLRIPISRLSISSRILSIHGNYPLRDSLLHGTNNYGILSRWQSLNPYSPISPYPFGISLFHPEIHSFLIYLLLLRYLSIYLMARGSRHMANFPLVRPRPGPLLLFVCAARPLSIRGPVPRRPSNINCWLLAPDFYHNSLAPSVGTTVLLTSMHLRSCNLPRPSASSPPGNRSHPMANPGQVPDLEGLHHEMHDMAEQMRIMNENKGRPMQLLTTANPQLPAVPSVPDVERSRHSNRSGDHSHNVSTERARGRRRAPSPSLRERSSSSESSQTRARVRKGRSPNRGDHTEARDKSTSQKIRDLDARLDAINTGTSAPVTVDALVRQTDPPFRKRVLRARISSKFKLPTQLGIYEGKTDPMDHLDSYKSLMSLQGCSDEVMCKAFSATLKGPARLRPGPLFDSLFKNVPETLSALQSKADKYIAAEELVEAKRRRRGKDDHKRKEPDTRRADYREETRYKRPDRDPKRSSDRHPRTPPCRPEFTLPPLNAPVAQVLSEIKHEEFVKWLGKIKTDPQKRNRNKYCEFHRDHGHNTEDYFQLKEQIADLIKRGYLRKYVATRPPPNSPERRYGDNRPTAGDIQTIHGGFGSGDYSTSSRKKACQKCPWTGRRRSLQPLLAIHC